MKIIKDKIFYLLLSTCLSNASFGQLKVEDEPHHKTVFQNSYLRLLDLTIMPGDTTLYHEHSKASAVIFLTKSALAIQNINDSAVITNVVPGDVVYRNYDKNPVVHRVWSADSNSFRCFVAEILDKKNYDDSCDVIINQQIKLLFHQQMVTAYSINFLPKQQYQFQQKNCKGLLLCISGYLKIVSNTKMNMMGIGSYLYIKPKDKIKIINTNLEKAQFILLHF